MGAGRCGRGTLVRETVSLDPLDKSREIEIKSTRGPAFEKHAFAFKKLAALDARLGHFVIAM
jgi:hypothetical protein